MLCYCANLKAIRYKSTSLNRILADKSHGVIVALLRQNHLKREFFKLNHGAVCSKGTFTLTILLCDSNAIDDYAKDGEPEVV